MDDDAVHVLRGQRGRQRRGALVDEAAREVVLDDEGPGRAGDPQDLPAPVVGQHRAGGVLEERLADEDPGAAGPEGLREQIGAYAAVVHGYGHGPQSRGARGGDHAWVGGGLDEHGCAGRGEGAQGGGEGALAAGGDQYAGGGDRAGRAADLAGEPRPQLVDALQGRALPRARPAPGPSEGGGQGAFGLEAGVEVAAAEFDDAGGRAGEGGEDAAGVDGAGHGVVAGLGAERDLLPGGVAGPGGGGVRLGPEGARAGPGAHQALGGQGGQRSGDGDGADVEALDEGPAGGQLLTGRVAVELSAQDAREFGHAVTLMHDSTR